MGQWTLRTYVNRLMLPCFDSVEKAQKVREIRFWREASFAAIFQNYKLHHHVELWPRCGYCAASNYKTRKMTTPAATAILTAPSKPRRVSCICSSDECKQLTICFQSVDNDIRGLFMQLPSIGGSILAGLKEHRVKRTLIHLNQYSPDKDTWQCTIDRRKSSPKQMKLRSEEPEVVQSKKYIANHHAPIQRYCSLW